MSMRACVGPVAFLVFLCLQTVHAAEFEFRFVDDPAGSFAARGWMSADSSFQRNFRAAGALWGALIHSDRTIVVKVQPDLTRPRFGAGIAWLSPASTAAESPVWQPGALASVLSSTPRPQGVEEDMFILVNPGFADQWYWADDSPETRQTGVPYGKTDLVSIVLHEIGHALGITSWRSRAPADFGAYAHDVRTVFDIRTHLTPPASGEAEGTIHFSGPVTRLVNGGRDLPLTFLPFSHPGSTQNFDHVDCNGGEDHRVSLMNGCGVPTDGSRMRITPLDLAMVADLGYPLRSVFFPDTRTLLAAVPVATPGGPRMLAGLLRLVDDRNLVLELEGLGMTLIAASDATYDAGTGMLSLRSMVINDTVQRYHVGLAPLPASGANLRFQVVEFRPADEPTAGLPG